VDDEPLVLSALSRLVRPDGVRLLTAASGEEALALLEEQASSIGVIISDYAMPRMNGAELLQAVRRRWPDITRVLLTGNADLPSAARAVNEGELSRLYTKPWEPDEFRQAVAQALDQHRVVVDNRRLRALADEQALRLEQWNQRLEGLVAERTAELERANVRLQRGLLESVRMLLIALEQRLPQRSAQCKEVARLAGQLAADHCPRRWVSRGDWPGDWDCTALATEPGGVRRVRSRTAARARRRASRSPTTRSATRWRTSSCVARGSAPGDGSR
jgi:response regulator RpfG family c-di-GMP phosphodiesterase